MGHTGRIFQVNVSNGGVPKHAVGSAVVNQRGITTDRQADLRAHGSLDQALCLYSIEIIERLHREGHRVFAGCTGENITTEGVDWALMTPGTRVLLGDEVVAEVTDYAPPCNKNARWFMNGDFGRISGELHPGWARVYAKVIEGGEIRPGDVVRVEPEDAIRRVVRRSVPAVRWPRDFAGDATGGVQSRRLRAIRGDSRGGFCRMPLHPQAQQVLEIMAAMGLELSGEPADVRARMAEFPRPEGEAVGSVEDKTIPGPAGDIPVRIYTPAEANGGPLPAIVWFHGGGWVIGSLDSADYTCRMITNASGCKLISVDYRLAPEAKYPAAADDCFAATQWVAEHGDEIGVDGSRIAVGGDSAGGNLAAVVAQLAKEMGGPAIAFQALIYPVTDYGVDTASYAENAEGYLLTRDSMVWFWGHYLNSEADGAETKASPLRCSDLSGLPPAFVVTAEFDPLRDEGEAYAKQLKAAGVPVTQVRYEGQIHGFFANAAIDDGREAAKRAGLAIREALGAGVAVAR